MIEVNDTKIRIFGEGGQGVKLCTHILGEIINKNTTSNVCITADYDTVMRKGKIKAELIISKSQLFAPVFDEADISVILAQTKDTGRSRICVADSSLELSGLVINTQKLLLLPLKELAVEMGSDILQNMLLLGVLLKITGIQIEGLNLSDYIKGRNPEANINAVIKGYSLV